MKRKHSRLISEEIRKTIERLYLRINDRFPHSGLKNVCKALYALSKETDHVVRWITKPNYPMRILVGFVISLLGAVSIYSIAQFDLKTEGIEIADFVQMAEAGLSGLVLMGAGIAFLLTFESRRKRKRVTNAVNRLRYMAHLIDAHQLTKDPDRVTKMSIPTAHSPKDELAPYELGRYLDYCSEMLSLTSKVGFLYVQNFDDPIATKAVNDLENLTTGLSGKIWQKIMILRTIETA